jgi:hypothetical protein
VVPHIKVRTSIEVFENRALRLRKILGPERDEVKRGLEEGV